MKNRKSHQIELKKLQEYLESNNDVLYASSGDGKQLKIGLNGNFKVYNNNELVWQGMQPFRAVEKYNEL